ncbi:speedy protein 1-A-like isoform X1 [Amphibalanus amphitrite]|uniref:speedy protein 1-A-like isoform X1 n=1 Tax=Amphibalanus amphitrite TaxID=1232801 RepID=UPI001C919E7D|nr:speedy protein 1-A-like isoform X1 [Amphibalanus amphitrite]
MFVSLSHHGHERSCVGNVGTGFSSASQHCKHFGLSGGVFAVRNQAFECLSNNNLPKLAHPQNFRVRKLKTIHRAHHWNSKSASKLTVTTADIEVFFRLLEDSVVAAFLERDTCRRYADKYLVAMVFTYFIRANYSWRQYTRYNFFVGLYLAHDMEEDEEEYKFEVLPWLYGDGWRRRYPVLLRHRDALWRQIGYRAVVSRKCCDEVMSIRPHHPVWQRTRPDHHSGAFREYQNPDIVLGPFGPHRLPPVCRLCVPEEEVVSDDSGVAYLSDLSPPGAPVSEPGGAEGADGGYPGQMELSDSLLSPAVAEEAGGHPSPPAGADTFPSASVEERDSRGAALPLSGATVVG